MAHSGPRWFEFRLWTAGQEWGDSAFLWWPQERLISWVSVVTSFVKVALEPVGCSPLALSLSRHQGLFQLSCLLCVCVSCSVMSLCDRMDCSLPGSSVHGILQAGILELVAIPFFRGSSPSRDRIQISSIVGRFFTIWVTGQALCVYWVIINVNSLLVDVGNNFLWGKPSLGSVHKQA